MIVFRSRLHPAASSPQEALARGLAPLAAWLVGLMAVAAVLALTGGDLTPAWWAAALAFVSFGAAARFMLDRRIVEVATDGPDATVRTLWSALRAGPAPPLTRVLDVRHGAPFVTLALGRRVFELDERDWPDPAALRAALGAARAEADALPFPFPEP